jgi:CBS domain-containing protein
MTIRPGENLSEAAKIMREKNIGSLVVMEGKRIVGIITEKDFLKFAAKRFNWRIIFFPPLK